MLSNVKKGGEGKGEEKKRLHHLWRGEKNNQVVRRRTKWTTKTLSPSCDFAGPSFRDAPMHFTKQLGEVPSDWNAGSLHTVQGGMYRMRKYARNRAAKCAAYFWRTFTTCEIATLGWILRSHTIFI